MIDVLEKVCTQLNANNNSYVTKRANVLCFKNKVLACNMCFQVVRFENSTTGSPLKKFHLQKMLKDASQKRLQLSCTFQSF